MMSTAPMPMMPQIQAGVTSVTGRVGRVKVVTTGAGFVKVMVAGGLVVMTIVWVGSSLRVGDCSVGDSDRSYRRGNGRSGYGSCRSRRGSADCRTSRSRGSKVTDLAVTDNVATLESNDSPEVGLTSGEVSAGVLVDG